MPSGFVAVKVTGVLHLVHAPIGEVHRAVSKLKELGKRVGAVTNNTGKRFEDLFGLLKNLHLDIEIHDVVYPTQAIVNYLKSINFNKEVFAIASGVMRGELRDAGLKLTDQGDIIIEENIKALTTNLVDNANVGAVIFDNYINVTYIQLAKAAVYLNRPDVLFIVGSSDKAWLLGKGKKVLGMGGLQVALEDFVRRAPIVLAKPGNEFNEFVKQKFNIGDPSRTLFIGDSLTHDIYFAKNHGYQSLLVLSGITKLEDALQCSEDMVPDYYLNRFADIHDLISKKLNL